MRPYDAHTVSKMLAADAAALARELAPHGHREGNEWVAPSFTGSCARAWSMRIAGSKAGVWGEFDGTACGDALSAVAHVLYGGDRKQAYRWALARLGLASGTAPAAPARPAQPPRDRAAADHERATREAALRLFLGAEPSVKGTPVHGYLCERRVDPAELGRQPRALRFHPNCFNSEAGERMPAMLAAISGADGQHIATHRTYLAEVGGVWRKAPLRAPKKTLGTYAGGSIRLWRGASNKPLASAPENDTVVIGEGIETCLSVAIACPEYRVLAAVSLANLGRIDLPPQLLDIIIAADNDQGNAAAETALQRAVHRLLSQGRSVRVARSSVGKDFNDGINAE